MKVLLLFILLPFISLSQPGLPDTAIKPYLININDTIPFSKLGQNFSIYNYYFSSENHSLGVCYNIKADLIKSLVMNYDVSNIILEMPYSYSYLLNKFFMTGDSSYIYSNGEYIMWENKEDLFKLYDLYKVLPPGKKFKFWGIDFDIDYYRELFYTHAIQKMLEKKDIDEALRREVFDTSELSKKECIKVNDILRERILTDSGFIKQFIVANEFDDLSFIVSTSVKHDFIPKRDGIMFKRLASFEPYFIKSNNEIKAYGQFGSIHTERGKNVFVSRLENNDENRLLYGHKVCTFGSLFYDCHSKNAPEKTIENMHIEGEEIFRPVIEGSKTPGVSLIPNTEKYNKFNFTFCFYGYK